MNINNNYSNVNFQAKFVKSDSLCDIVNYAVEKGKFDKLNQARKNIDKAYLMAKLKVDIFYSNNHPALAITKYEPKKQCSGLSVDDYVPTNRVEFECQKPKANPVAYALKILIKMGNNAPKNNIYKDVVATRNKKSLEFMF
jgi:hypothetical protein